MNNTGAFIGASSSTETIYVVLVFVVTAALSLTVLAIIKAFGPEDPMDELDGPISEKAMIKLVQRLERERSIDPNRQS